jgi:hypothetical protein
MHSTSSTENTACSLVGSTQSAFRDHIDLCEMSAASRAVSLHRLVSPTSKVLHSGDSLREAQVALVFLESSGCFANVTVGVICYTYRMARDPRLTPIPDKNVAAPAKLLNEVCDKWKRALKASRHRKTVLYALLSVWIGISISTVRYWATVYSSYRSSFTFVPRTTEELANAFQTVLGIIMQWVGLATLALAVAGTANAIWVLYRHERSIRDALHEAHETGHHQDVLRCSGSSESRWHGFEQQNRRFLIGYLIAISVGLTLVIAGTLVQ